MAVVEAGVLGAAVFDVVRAQQSYESDRAAVPLN
jgi:hypothetical protein